MSEVTLRDEFGNIEPDVPFNKARKVLTKK
jgi:hypothetical protein